MGAHRQGRRNPDRRAVRRYDLSLPIEVRTVPPQQAEPISGRTRDISSSGLFFVIDEEFTPGSEIDFALILPAEITHGTEVFIRARGKVLRAEKRRENGIERVGVAAIIESYEIIRTKPTFS